MSHNPRMNVTGNPRTTITYWTGSLSWRVESGTER